MCQRALSYEPFMLALPSAAKVRPDVQDSSDRRARAPIFSSRIRHLPMSAQLFFSLFGMRWVSSGLLESRARLPRSPSIATSARSFRLADPDVSSSGNDLSEVATAGSSCVSYLDDHLLWMKRRHPSRGLRNRGRVQALVERVSSLSCILLRVDMVASNLYFLS